MCWASEVREGFLYREGGRFFFARLPDGQSPRYEIRWKKGGLAAPGTCFRNENSRCGRFRVKFEKIIKEHEIAILVDASI